VNGSPAIGEHGPGIVHAAGPPATEGRDTTANPAMARRPAPPVTAALRGFMVAGFWLVLWQVATEWGDQPYFPTPVRIARSAAQLWFSGPPTQLLLTDLVLHDIAASLARLVGGWSAAAALGVILGIGVGRSARAYDYLRLPLTLARAVPQTLLVPVLLVLFGLGPSLQVACIVLGGIWPILLNTADGARDIDQALSDSLRVARLSRARWVLWIVVPAAAPRIFTGLRITSSIALILMVVSELVGSTDGIGYQLARARATFDLPAMWAWIFLLGVLGYGLNRLLLLAQHRLLPWQPRLGQETA
jgi:ABC-type nitrate/sulfonate/bicarbonate transport system permease component